MGEIAPALSDFSGSTGPGRVEERDQVCSCGKSARRNFCVENRERKAAVWYYGQMGRMKGRRGCLHWRQRSAKKLEGTEGKRWRVRDAKCNVTMVLGGKGIDVGLSA